MNTEQELADFEAWWELTPILKENKRTIAEKAYQAGRAAQQSQDREDAERWRYAMDWDTTGFAVCRRVGDTGVCWEPIKTDGPIDHARRIEGDR